jgi:solute carrier family 25 folate transporter 32
MKGQGNGMTRKRINWSVPIQLFFHSSELFFFLQSNFAYTVMSITSKLAALALTYPYQVVRSRIQVRYTRPFCLGQFDPIPDQDNGAIHQFPNIPATIKRTWSREGIRGFYRGLGTNLVRVLPGTCVTFVVYENLAWLLRTTAAKRLASKS